MQVRELISFYDKKDKRSPVTRDREEKSFDSKYVFAKMDSSPDEISVFIRGVIKSNPTHFANLLTSTNSHKSTLLHLIAQRVPALLLDLIELAKTDKTMATAISNALALQDDAKWTPFGRIATESVESLPALFEFAKVNSEFRSSLAKALEARDSMNGTGFHTVVQYASRCLPQLFALTHDEKMCRSVAIALITKNDQQTTGFSFIEAHCSPVITIKLVHHLINIANWLRKNLAENQWQSFLQSSFADYVADTIAPGDYEKYVDRRIDFIAVGLSRSQTQILQQLAIYLRKINNSDTLLLADAIANHGGLCHGFAICDSVMHSLGKSAWWDEIQRLVAEENQDDPTIMPKTYRLPDGDKDSTLTAIFELALNFIVFDQAGIIGKHTFGFMPDTLVQNDFLKPATSNHIGLEISVGRQVKRVKGHDRHASYFEQDDLVAFLNQNKAVIQQSICIMGPLGHTCSLTLDGNYWYLRNCNRNNGAPYKVRSENTAQLAAIMHKKMGNNLCFFIASFDDADIRFNKESVSFQANNNEEKQVNERIKKNLNKDSLISIFENSTSAEVLVFIQQIKSNPLFRKQLADLLIEKNSLKATVLCLVVLRHGQDVLRELIECVKLDKYFRARFSAAFTEQCNDGMTILHHLALKSPDQLLILIELIKPHEDLRACFATTLTLQSTDKWTALHFIVQFSPSVLPALMDLVKTDKVICDSFSSMLHKKNNNGWTVLHEMAEKSPATLLTLIEVAKTDNTLRINFLNAFVTHNNNNDTMLHILIQLWPGELPAFVELIKKDNDFCANFSAALSLPDRHKKTGWHMIAEKTPAMLFVLIELANTNDTLRISFLNAFAAQDNSGATVLHRLTEDVLTKLLNLAKTNEMIVIALSKALATQNEAKRTPFDQIVKNFSKLLPTLFELAETKTELQCSLARALSARGLDQWTGFHMFTRYAPHYLPQLFALTQYEEIRRSVATALIAKNNNQRTGFCFVEICCSSDIQEKLRHGFMDMAHWLRSNLTTSEWGLFLQTPFGSYIKSNLDIAYQKYFFVKATAFFKFKPQQVTHTFDDQSPQQENRIKIYFV